jgi:hypothetical protein
MNRRAVLKGLVASAAAAPLVGGASMATGLPWTTYTEHFKWDFSTNEAFEISQRIARVVSPTQFTGFIPCASAK